MQKSAGGEATRESDYFSFGVICYLMLTGRHPFHFDNPSGLFNEDDNIQNPSFSPAPIGKGETDAPAEVVSLVMSLISRTPEDRVTAFANMMILLRRDSLPEPPDSPTMQEPLTAKMVDLTPLQSDSLASAYQAARHRYFMMFDGQGALQILDTLLANIKWERFKGSEIAAIADCWSLESFIYNGMGLHGEAVRTATNGLLVDSDHVNSLFAKGSALGSLGRKEEAIKDLELAERTATDAMKKAQIRRALFALKGVRSEETPERSLEAGEQLLLEALQTLKDREEFVLGARIGLALRRVDPFFAPIRFGAPKLSIFLNRYPDILTRTDKNAGTSDTIGDWFYRINWAKAI